MINKVNIGGEEYDLDCSITINDKNYKLVEIKPEPKQKRWERVAEDETFYYISPKGMVIARKDNGASHNGYYTCGNYFHALAEATYYRDKQQLESDIRRWKWEHDTGTVDWKNKEPKINIVYDYERLEFEISFNEFRQHLFTPYFSTRELAQQCITSRTRDGTFGDRIKDILERGMEWE